MKKLPVFVCVMMLAFGATTPTNATLIDRGGGLIYDTDLNITWLQDANYAKTSGYNADGRMTWSDAVAWADQLSYGGFDDWRLPTSVDGPNNWGYNGTTTAGYNITTSEMGHLFYDSESLGNKGYYDTNGNPQSGGGLTNTGPFSNLQADYYWSGTEYSLYPDLARSFLFLAGVQDGGGKDRHWFALAVRPGDIAPVPEPATMLLLAFGLVGLAGVRKLRKR